MPSKTTTGELEVAIIGGPELHSKLKTGKNLNDDVLVHVWLLSLPAALCTVVDRRRCFLQQNKIVDGVADYLEALDKDSKKK